MKLFGLVAILVGLVSVTTSDTDDDTKKESVGTVIGIDLGTTYSWYINHIHPFLNMKPSY